MPENVILHAVKMTLDGKITIPQFIREAMGWKPGTKLDMKKLDNNRISIREALPEDLIGQPDKLEKWHQEQKRKGMKLYKSAGGS